LKRLIAASPAYRPSMPASPAHPPDQILSNGIRTRGSRQPEQIAEDTIVPIESLLYRGSAALERAIEIRDELRQSETPADADALDELFDLLELARAE